MTPLRAERATYNRRVSGKKENRAARGQRTAITTVRGARRFHRGEDAAALAATRSLEDVVSLFWTGAFGADIFDTPLHVVSGGPAAGDLGFVPRAQSILPLVAARDPLARDLSPQGAAQTGWRVLNLLTSVAAESSELAASVEETLARAWAPRKKNAAPLLRAALIASADDEEDVATRAARCVASAQSGPYAVVLAALATLEGTRERTFGRIGEMLDAVRRAKDLRAAIEERGRLEGFGRSDARAARLLEMLPESRDTELVRSIAANAPARSHPTLEYALAAIERALRLPSGSALTLFAIGRTIGWIAHAIEEYGAVPSPRRAGRG